MGGGWGKEWTCSSFPVTMFEDNSPPQKFISLFVTFGVWVALVLLFQLFLCPFMQQQLQTTLCNAILLFHCLVLISRRVLVYFYADSPAFFQEYYGLFEAYCKLHLFFRNCSTGCFKWSTYRISFGNY